MGEIKISELFLQHLLLLVRRRQSVISVGADLITPPGDADQPKVDTILYDHTPDLLIWFHLKILNAPASICE